MAKSAAPQPLPDQPLPDAPPDNWVDRRAPTWARPWLRLGRFDRPIGIWLLLLPGLWGIALSWTAGGRLPQPLDLWLVCAFALGSALMRAAGCAYNDIVDRDIDARVSRTAGRPLPSGQISVRQAWAFLVGCSLVSLLILLTLGREAIGLGLASLVLVAAYPFMKRITWWPQAWLGLTFNWGVLMGFAAGIRAGDPTALAWPAAGLLYAGAVFWTLGYDTLYALQDREDDALIGVRSSARRLGRRVRLGVGLAYGLAVALMIAALWLADAAPLAWIGLAGFAAHLAWQVRNLALDDPAGALRLFRTNREAGLILLGGLVVTGWLT